MIKELNFIMRYWIYSKYACPVTLNNKKGITIANAFQKSVDESDYKLKKMWVDKDSEFHNRSMKSWLNIYSTQ